MYTPEFELCRREPGPTRPKDMPRIPPAGANPCGATWGRRTRRW
jgi:hypothetical protein